MKVFVVGSGKLATEILSTLQGPPITGVYSWTEISSHKTDDDEEPVVVHAGSGRELREVFDFCRKLSTPLIELATGSTIGDFDSKGDFPIVICPNTNILLIKFLAMISKAGDSFQDCKKTILESHQFSKTSAPGTAYSIARSLHVAEDQIESVRDPVVQEQVLGIPTEYLSRHAYHKITIGDPAVNLTFETKVFGVAPYAPGLARILGAVTQNKLENRVYNILEFIEEGWV